MGKKVFLSHLAGNELKEYLSRSGYTVTEIFDLPVLGKHIASHPDLVICKTIDGVITADPFLLAETYPNDARYCAVFLGKHMLHRLDITAPEVLKKAKNLGLELINVRQGYTKCSTVVVDKTAVITSDKGIANALKNTAVDLLTVSEGHVFLPGFDYGFIGGASGRVGDEIIFNGDLSAHPDFVSIVNFIESRGLKVKYFPTYPLTDIGSIIEA